jgi:hypothetical protein
MKKLLVLLAFIQTVFLSQGQDSKGKIIVEKINSPALQNPGGENPVRSVSIYLPPGYDQTTNRYPVIYYLPGFSLSDTSEIADLNPIINKAISTQILKKSLIRNKAFKI